VILRGCLHRGGRGPASLPYWHRRASGHHLEHCAMKPATAARDEKRDIPVAHLAGRVSARVAFTTPTMAAAMATTVKMTPRATMDRCGE